MNSVTASPTQFCEGRRRFTRSERRRLAAESPLTLHLGRLGIAVLDKQSVRDYKAKKLHDLQQPTPQTLTKRQSIGWMVNYGLLTFVVATMIGNFVAIANTRSAFVWVALAGILAAAVGKIGRNVKYEHTEPARLASEWKTLSLEQYVRQNGNITYALATPVPQELLERGRRAQREIPNSEVVVDYLYLDPFLRIIHQPAQGRSDEAYIGFWDENFVQ